MMKHYPVNATIDNCPASQLEAVIGRLGEITSLALDAQHTANMIADRVLGPVPCDLSKSAVVGGNECLVDKINAAINYHEEILREVTGHLNRLRSL